MNAPFIHTSKKPSSRPKILLTALLPILIWSVFSFGARVLTLCAVSAASALLLDIPIRKYILKYSQIDLMTAVFAVMTVFAMPVTVPLWFPTVGAILIVIAKNLSVFRPKVIFNPFIFAATVLNFAFPSIMTAFTKPFAYFSAFDVTLDQKLVDCYRVISPLQYIADGSVYEDGLLAQFYGFASGNIGEIAVLAIILSAVWLYFQGELDITATATFIAVILVLGLAYPSNDAENNHFAFSILLSGAIAFLAVFGLNERSSVPLTALGKLIFALIAGGAVFATRKFFGGFEFSYPIFLVLSFFSPILEKITRQKPIPQKKSEGEL